MNIKEIEQRLLSHIDACVCCGAERNIEKNIFDHHMKTKTHVIEYDCCFMIRFIYENEEIRSVELLNHCKYKQETLKQLVQSI